VDESGEANRLAKLYADMSDGQLEKVAAQSAELTGEARQALRDEIAKRKLSIEVADPPPQVFLEPELQEWVRVKRYRDLRQADIGKSVLDSSGIESLLVDHNVIRMDWFWSNLIGGVRLIVRPEDTDEANALLRQPILEQFDYAAGETFEQPRCPKCNSLDIAFESIHEGIGYASAWLIGLPLLIRSEKWICNACDARWVEEDDEPSEPAETP
jgi:hypothetical protein